MTRQKDQPIVASYFPFCNHSPEYIALQEGEILGTDIQFIDLPTGEKDMETDPSLRDESRFNASDYVMDLAAEITETGA